MRLAFVPFAVLVCSSVHAATGTATTDPSAAYFKIDMSRPPAPPTSVNVLNFPDVQPVSGTVSVDNFPTVQSVGGTVDVGNLPLSEDGSVRVTSAQSRQPVLIELLDSPLVVPSGETLSAPATVNTAGYSSVGLLVTVTSGGYYARPAVEWRWGSDETFGKVIDNRNGNYGAPGITGLCDLPANTRMVCSVAGAELRVSILNTYTGPIPIDSIRVYLIP